MSSHVIACHRMSSPHAAPSCHQVLPTSNAVVNRSTIARHLLSDPSDPFNRNKLTLDMVRPDTEMKVPPRPAPPSPTP